MSEASKPLRVVVCGGGNGAHTITGLASSRPDTLVRVLTLFGNEADTWTQKLEEEPLLVTVCNSDNSETTITSRPALVTKDPAKALDRADVIFLTVPSFAHQTYIEAIEPYVRPGTIVSGMPSQAGFEFQLVHSLANKSSDCTIISFETLPWACRLVEFGRHTKIHGTKQHVKASVIGEVNFVRNPLQVIQAILGPKPIITRAKNYLEVTLLGKSSVHPPLMYCFWKDWTGESFKEPPIFYQGIDENAVQMFAKVDEEIQSIAKAMQRLRGDLDLSGFVNAYDWLVDHYHDQIDDKSTLLTAFRTNRGFNDLRHPMKKQDDGTFVPDFQNRYIKEDVPYGLVVFRGLADIAGVETPVMNEVIAWCQGIIGKEYLVDNKLKGKNLTETRAPQVYGFHTMQDLMRII